MGHHMKSNILKIRDALSALTPRHDGRRRQQIYLYGEGWNFGEVANNARGVNATQAKHGRHRVAPSTTGRATRCAGGGPFSGLQEPGLRPTGPPGTTPTHRPGRPGGRARDLSIARTGSRPASPASSPTSPSSTPTPHGDLGQVDYQGQPAGYTAIRRRSSTTVDATTTRTLWDVNQLKAPVTATMAERVRMQTLGASVIALGHGHPFFTPAIDILRSKSLDRNS